MKILCFIDSLGPGGAQRQLVTIAAGLKKKGHTIRFLLYRDDDHFSNFLHEKDISYHIISPSLYLKRILEVRRILREGWQDVVLAFLEAPSFYAELAGIPNRRWGLVVGERLADPDMMRGIKPLYRHFHRFADAVVCNSYTNKLILDTVYPFLIQKNYAIYNTVNSRLFYPKNEMDKELVSTLKKIKIVVAASYHEKKNVMNVAKALLYLKKKKLSSSVVVHWYGDFKTGAALVAVVKRFLSENDLAESFFLHSAIRNIEEEFLSADVIGLFSFYEGLPNVVCEGMACGKPILMSNVCDASNLVKDGKNGFLCDPSSHIDIAEKILQFVQLSEAKRQEMGSASEEMAKSLFSEEMVISRYENILMSVANQAKISIDCNWPDIVPESAITTVDKWIKNV